MPAKITANRQSSGQKMPPKLRLKLANESENLLAKVELNPLHKIFKYYLIHSKQMNEPTFNRLMALFESLMRTMYEQSSWGWNEQEKLAEWKHQRTRIIIVTKNNVCDNPVETITYGKLPGDDEDLVGFMCFRYESGADKNECALYVYEVHVAAENQRQGLGEELMRMAKSLALGFKMDKIMLTVFRSNLPALQFYQKLKFNTDKSSPAKNEADYVILSSTLKDNIVK